MRDLLVHVLGGDPVGMTYPMTDIFAHPVGSGQGMKGPTNLLQGKAWKYTFWPEIGPDGLSLYEICFRMIPEELCDEICRTVNIGKAYFIFLVWGEQLFGNVGIFLPPDRDLDDTQVIESFLRQASIAIARRQTEDRLRRSEKRFRGVMDLSASPAALIGSDGRYLFVNGKFTEAFGYTLQAIPTGKAWFEQAFPDPVRRKEAVAAWKSDLEKAGTGQIRPRTFDVRCMNGECRTVLFRPVTLADGTQYVTYETSPGIP